MGVNLAWKLMRYICPIVPAVRRALLYLGHDGRGGDGSLLIHPGSSSPVCPWQPRLPCAWRLCLGDLVTEHP